MTTQLDAKVYNTATEAATLILAGDPHEAARLLFNLAQDVKSHAKRCGPPLKRTGGKTPYACFDCGGDLTGYQYDSVKHVQRKGENARIHYDCQRPDLKESPEAEKRRIQREIDREAKLVRYRAMHQEHQDEIAKRRTDLGLPKKPTEDYTKGRKK